jgi:hypothetical protein
MISWKKNKSTLTKISNSKSSEEDDQDIDMKTVYTVPVKNLHEIDRESVGTS